MSVSVIQQTITAGGNFDGTLPPGDPVLDQDIKRFPAAATGGLFDFEITGPHRLMSVEPQGVAAAGWPRVRRK